MCFQSLLFQRETGKGVSIQIALRNISLKMCSYCILHFTSLKLCEMLLSPEEGGGGERAVEVA